MSRIAKQPIDLPTGINVKLENGAILITGPLGSLSRTLHSDIKVTLLEDNKVKIEPAHRSISADALSGTFASHIKNMIVGVAKGYEKKLIIEGVGLRFAVSGNNIKLDLGFSHPVELLIPEGLKVIVEKNQMTITGIDKEQVGEFAAKIRALKKTEPYKGKGIRYSDEIPRRKQGKKVTA
ncbi:MAG: 50S ribosomal protein L6 [Candidatus Paceibacterota bacterium]|jgi:large subunit ribosomal protein L6